MVLHFMASAVYAHEPWTEYPDEGVQLGVGWDASKDQKVNNVCIEGAQETFVKTQASSTTIGEVVDKHQLLRSLHISASAQAQWLAGSASAKMDYLTSKEIRSETTTVAVYAWVINGAHYLGVRDQNLESKLTTVDRSEALSDVGVTSSSGLKLKPEFEKLWNENRQQFFKKCGTHYVAAYREGAELVGFLTASDLTTDQKSSIAMSLSGSVVGQHGSTDVTQTIQEIYGVHRFDLEFRKSGGWGTAMPTNKDALFTAISNLNSDAAAAPYPFQILVSSYDRLMHTEEPEENPNASALDHIMARYWRLLALYQDFLAVDAHKPEYLFDWGITAQQFDKTLDDLHNAVLTVRNVARDCYRTQQCVQRLKDVPSEYDFSSSLPIRKSSFAADIALRESAAKAQIVVTKFNNAREAEMRSLNKLCGGCPKPACSSIFTGWAEPAWLHGPWPFIAAFELKLRLYPLALKAEIGELRLAAKWRAHCGDAADIDCIPKADLRARQDAITVTGRNDTVNGAGARPFGDATKCGSDHDVQFRPNID